MGQFGPTRYFSFTKKKAQILLDLDPFGKRDFRKTCFKQKTIIIEKVLLLPKRVGVYKFEDEV